jgi:hypothetical protein
MLNRIIYGDDIPAHAKSLAIKALYIKWKTLSQLKRLTLTDFLESDEKVSGNFLIILHTGNDDYAVIYHGAEHRKAFGQDLSGQVLSQAAGRIGRDVRPIYDQVRESGTPVRIIYASEGTQTAAGWERIILPLKIAGEIRILVCYSEALTLASEVHGFLFDNSPAHADRGLADLGLRRGGRRRYHRDQSGGNALFRDRADHGTARSPAPAQALVQ